MSELENFVLKTKINVGSESKKIIATLDAEKEQRQKMEKLFEQKSPILAMLEAVEDKQESLGLPEDPVLDAIEDALEGEDETEAEETKAFDPYASEHVAKPEKVVLADGTQHQITQLQSKPIRTQNRSYDFEGLFSGNSTKGKKGDFSLEIEKSPTMQRGELSLGKYDFSEEKTSLEDQAIREAFDAEKTEVSLKENL